MGFNSAFKGLKLLKKTGNGRLNNLNDPVLNVLKYLAPLTTTQESNLTIILTPRGQQNRIQDNNYCNTFSKTDDDHEHNADTFDIARANKLSDSTPTETLTTRTVA